MASDNRFVLLCVIRLVLDQFLILSMSLIRFLSQVKLCQDAIVCKEAELMGEITVGMACVVFELYTV